MTYTVYGIYRRCEICDDHMPLAAGITHNDSNLRLVKYRCIRKRSCPKCIKEFPKNYVIRRVHSGLLWEEAYGHAERYKKLGIVVLSCSRTQPNSLKLKVKPRKNCEITNVPELNL